MTRIIKLVILLPLYFVLWGCYIMISILENSVAWMIGKMKTLKESFNKLADDFRGLKGKKL